MSTRSRFIMRSFIGLSCVAFFAACGGAKPSQNTAPAAPVVYDKEATPTYTPPAASTSGASGDSTTLEAPPSTILNRNQNVPIYIGQLKLRNTRISYSSIERRMIVSGVATLNKDNSDNAEQLAEKSFSLVGAPDQGETSFLLRDESVAPTASDMNVRAQASCLPTSMTEQANCSHVVVTIIVKYNNKYYTEQVEVNNQPAPDYAPPQAPSDTSDVMSGDDSTDQRSDQDQADNNLQSEDESDGSVPGRYEAPIENIDLEALFADEAPPATSASSDATSGDNSAAVPSATTPDHPVSPPRQPQPVPTPRPAPPTPRTPAPTPPPQQPPLAPPARPTPPPAGSLERRLSPDLLQTREGTVRQINQAIGLPYSGSLRNATSLMTKMQALGDRADFELVHVDRRRYYCTYDMSQMIQRSADMINQEWNKKLYVADTSDSNGGRIRPHASHQMGVDADIAYPTDVRGLKFPLVVNKATRAYFPNNYSVEKTFDLFKFYFSQSDIQVDRIFVDQRIIAALCDYAKTHHETTGQSRDLVKKMFENMQHVRGHGDHFHLRLKCSPYDPSCRARVYRKMPDCR